MKALRTVQTSMDERRTWGRCFRSYKGATATGMLEDDMETSIEGGLSASVPLNGAAHVKALWEAAGLNKTDRQSGWQQVDNFHYFLLDIVTCKFKPGLFSRCRWLTVYGFWFAVDSTLLGTNVIDFPKLGYSNTSSIAETCILIDRTTLAEWPFVSKTQALG